MTIATQTSKAGPYVGDGIQTEFPYSFPVTDTAHVSAYLDGAKLETGYAAFEGTVRFETPPPRGSLVVLLREVPITQETDIQNNTAFYPEIIESSLDKLTMICQQLAEELERALTIPPGMSDDGSMLKALQQASVLAEAARLAAEKANAALELIRQLLAKASLFGNYVIVTGLNDDGYMAVDKASLPNALTTNTGKIYPIEKGSLTESETEYLIDPKPYLAYMNTPVFEGEWLVWRTGGQRGDTGKSAYQIALDLGFEGTEEEWVQSLGTTVVSEGIEAHDRDSRAHLERFAMCAPSVAGSIMPYVGVSDPEGYLVCEGGEVSRTAYARLFGVIGTAFGAGDGSTTFNLPDLRDRILQGSSIAGTLKGIGLPEGTGTYNVMTVRFYIKY